MKGMTAHFIRVCCVTYAFVMSGAALFMSASLTSILIGAIIGAALGAFLGLLLGTYAQSRPSEDWIEVSEPSGLPIAEVQTGCMGSVLGRGLEH